MMAAQKLSGSGKRRAPKASLTWTEDMRISLDILQKDDSLTWSHRSQAFHSLWGEHIRACGLETVPHTTLRSQCSNAERKKSKNWAKIAAGPQTCDEIAVWQRLRERVEVALENLDTAPKALPVLRKGIRSQLTRYPVPTPPATDAPTRSAAADAVRSTPLSKRLAIATWDPNAGLSDVEDDEEQEQEQESESEPEPEPQPAAKRRRTTRAQSEIQVQVQRRPQRAATSASRRAAAPSSAPRTPKKTPRKDLPRSPYHRPGDALRGFNPPNLTAAQHASSEEELTPVLDDRIHPPLSSLFFRYYVPRPDELGRSQNGEDGFVAGRFAHSVRMYMPPPPHPEWVDIYNHIDGVKHPSPFISVSNALFWIFRLALKEAKSKGTSDGRIAIIDAQKLDKRGVFHAAPLHKETKKTFGYHEGAWNYSGSHEFLIWREIQGDAIIKTIKVKDLLQFIQETPSMDEALAFSTSVSSSNRKGTSLSSKGGYKTGILPAFRARNLALRPATVEGIAALIDFLGLNQKMDGISHIVSDIIQGWALHLDSSTNWAAFADIFEQALFRRAAKGIQQPNLRNFGTRLVETRLGFLDGLRWGCSKNFNPRHNPRDIRRMQKQAQKVGLHDPVKILTDELDAAKIRLSLLANTSTSTRLVQSSETATEKRKRLLLKPAAASYQQYENDDEDEDSIVVAQPRCRQTLDDSGDRDEDEDEDEDGEDSDDVFEIDSNGFVV